MNSKPTVPIAKQPLNDQIVGSTPILWIANATDAEGDPLYYDFDGYHDSACVNGPAISLIKVPATADSTVGIFLRPKRELPVSLACAVV